MILDDRESERTTNKITGFSENFDSFRLMLHVSLGSPDKSELTEQYFFMALLEFIFEDESNLELDQVQQTFLFPI